MSGKKKTFQFTPLFLMLTRQRSRVCVGVCTYSGERASGESRQTYNFRNYARRARGASLHAGENIQGEKGRTDLMGLSHTRLK